MLLKLEDKLLGPAKVFGFVDRRKMSLKEAATVADYSYRHLTRLYRHHKTRGLKRLFQRHRRRPPAKLTPQHIELGVCSCWEGTCGGAPNVVSSVSDKRYRPETLLPDRVHPPVHPHRQVAVKRDGLLLSRVDYF